MPTHRSDFAVIVLPDTQAYTHHYPHILTAQTRWIRENAQAENIRFVVHVGDITCYNPHGDEADWQRADESISLLDGIVPYALSVGNHDIGGPAHTDIRDTLFNQYFPSSRYEHEPWYGGHAGSGNENSYAFFESGDMRFMVVLMEHLARNETLEWANDVVASHAECRTIVVTHGYLFCDNTRLSEHTPKPRHIYVPPGWDPDSNHGEQIWEKFVSQHKNIFLVLCGHVAGLFEEDPGGTGRLTSAGVHGNGVHQLLADYEWIGQGGDGWLRILRFAPDADRISVETFSPFLGESLTDDENRFELPYPMG